jgi:arginyl-tRNA synthetase
MYREIIIKAIKKAAKVKEVNLDVPERQEFGDYSTNIALRSGPPAGEAGIVASDLVAKLEKDPELAKIVDKIEVVHNFINFYLTIPGMVTNLAEINENYGKSQEGKGKTVVVDYSSPNIAKAFGIGHLRSTIIGQALYNLYSFLGYKVIGDNHLGDWGTQFGKLLYMIDIEKPRELTIAKLEELYVKFHQMAENDPKIEEEGRLWFKKLEDGDPKAKKLWQKCVEVSLAEFDRIYKILGVKIDFCYGESFYQPYLAEVIKKGQQSQGAIVIKTPGFETPLMLAKSDEATTYATRDLATLKFRTEKWQPDLIIYEVGAEQTAYFQQLFAAARLLGYVNEKTSLIHTKHGMYLAADGKKFTTREGKTVKLQTVLEEAEKRAVALGSKDKATAQMVGVGAIKYFDLSHSVTSDIVFDWDKMMALEGNSGPYLQYTTARINSVILKRSDLLKSGLNRSDLSQNPEELTLLRTFIHFPEIIESAAVHFSPNLLCNYLYDLAQKFNNFYNLHRILGSENSELRIMLTSATGQILKSGLSLLGIESPEKM